MKYYQICPECHALVEVSKSRRFEYTLCMSCLFEGVFLNPVCDIWHVMKRLDAAINAKIEEV